MLFFLCFCSFILSANTLSLSDAEKYINNKISKSETYKQCTNAYIDTYNYIVRVYSESSTERKVALKKLNKVYLEAYIEHVTQAMKGKLTKDEKIKIYKECMRLLDLYPSDIRLQNIKNSLQ